MKKLLILLFLISFPTFAEFHFMDVVKVKEPTKDMRFYHCKNQGEVIDYFLNDLYKVQFVCKYNRVITNVIEENNMELVN